MSGFGKMHELLVSTRQSRDRIAGNTRVALSCVEAVLRGDADGKVDEERLLGLVVENLKAVQAEVGS